MTKPRRNIVGKFTEGVRTILFKCRQKKNLTRVISRVLKLAEIGPSSVHPDLRA